jgi:hypothetical protein
MKNGGRRELLAKLLTLLQELYHTYGLCGTTSIQCILHVAVVSQQNSTLKSLCYTSNNDYNFNVCFSVLCYFPSCSNIFITGS